MIGIATSNFYINSSNFNNCGYYYYYNYSNLYLGPHYNCSNKKTSLSNVKDEVVVIMNMKKRTLKFIINNEDKRDSHTNIPIDKPLFLSVYLLDLNYSVEISEF